MQQGEVSLQMQKHQTAQGVAQVLQQAQNGKQGSVENDVSVLPSVDSEARKQRIADLEVRERGVEGRGGRE
jgi:hypothetical protein